MRFVPSALQSRQLQHVDPLANSDNHGIELFGTVLDILRIYS